MLIYNLIAEITADQFVIIAVYEVLAICILTFILKKRLLLKTYLFTVIIAFVLSLISLIFTRGGYGGTAYHERLGWPVQYYIISRNIELGTNIAVPYSFDFIFSKFFANTFLWLYLPIVIYTIYLNKKRTKTFKIFISITLLAFIGMVSGFSLFNLFYK